MLHKFNVHVMYKLLPFLKWLDLRVFKCQWLWLCDYTFELSVAADLDRMGEDHPIIQMVQQDYPEAIGALFQRNDH